MLWLVAGGFCLGYCLQDTGLAKVLIQAIPFGSMSVVLVLVVAGLVCYLLSNFISNSATAALLIPILIVVANGIWQTLKLPTTRSSWPWVALPP